MSEAVMIDLHPVQIWHNSVHSTICHCAVCISFCKHVRLSNVIHAYLRTYNSEKEGLGSTPPPWKTGRDRDFPAESTKYSFRFRFLQLYNFYFTRPQSSGGKRGDYQNCSVLYCALKLCTVISTLR